MTLPQRCQPSNGLRRTAAMLAIVAALGAMCCAASVSAGPRTWANEGLGGAKQPGWMPFSLGDRTPHPALARITAVEGNTLSQGSGTLVEVRGQHGLIVTNWHVVRDARGPIVATFPDGFRSAATVLKTDPDWDLAALLIWRPNATPIAIATTAPRPGDPLTIAGYGAGSYRAVTGRCTQYVAPGADLPYEMVEVSAQARQGDSGGPMLNERGELAGVLFGAGGGTTSGTFCGRVRGFLQTAWPHGMSPEADTFVSVPAQPPRTQWPADHIAAGAEVAATPGRAVFEPAASYSTGSSLFPATSMRGRSNDSNRDVDFSRLVGTTPLEQGKSILAAVGMLAICLQLARLFRLEPKKPAGAGK